ncbi:unnamed protein product [Medioppia subpectinata]|uniref:Nuclear receptor domain-containing protein n=1 Tax=Medioppia subpectinata TaxID=1979941 RepID=A0A7R9KB75_9ACAR|nr:unnamed protein product [Medioppia subpectinata]CAG2099969.1 unnamed protein product [Medioppia subpectinata]
MNLHGRNYLVITCEGCKVFFRRNALKLQTFMCPSNGRCDITVKTRQLCKKCRLEKCLANGMNKELAIVPVFKEITDYNSLNALESSRVSELIEACNDQESSAIFDLDSFKLDKLHAIILFDPKRPNLIHKEPVKLEQQLYIYLLQRYLLLKYRSESESKLQELMFLMKDLNVLREIQYTYGIQEFMPYSHYIGPLIKEIFICPANSQCVINKSTRAICKLCRLNKCYAAGMRKVESIRSNEENKIRKQMLELNILKHKPNGYNSVVSSPVSTATDVSTHSQQFIECHDFLTEIIGKTVNISDEELTQQISEIDIKLSLNENKVKTTELNSVPELAVMPIIRPLHNPNDWNCLETNRIAELLSATKIFEYKLSANMVSVNDFKDMICKYNIKFKDLVADIVQFAKCLNGFLTRICSDDQMVLLKSVNSDYTLQP